MKGEDNNHLRVEAMKFWKILRSLIEETLPEWQDKYLSYKDLKQHLRLFYPKDDDHNPPAKRCRLDLDLHVSPDAPDCLPELSKDYFVRLLEDEVEKFNGFFAEKEEVYVIRLKVLYSFCSNLLNFFVEYGNLGIFSELRI